MLNNYYLLLLLPPLIFARYTQHKINATFDEYSRYGTYSRMTGYEAARRILDANGLRYVSIERTAGRLTDHFDPTANVIRLSRRVYDSSSISAIGVAAHEAGHAVQYAVGYFPIKVRAAVIPVCQFGSNASMPVLFMGILFNSGFMIDLGLILFATIVLFQFVTLPVEFDASNRAVRALSMSGIVTEREIYGVRKVLKAAAMTYVAALVSALANLLRMILIFSGRRDD